jgi:hypothetical protein
MDMGINMPLKRIPISTWVLGMARMLMDISSEMIHNKERLLEIWPFSRYPELLNKGTAFFHHYGGKSVLFRRFVGPVHPIIPVVAGIMGMAPVHFSVVNVSST